MNLALQKDTESTTPLDIVVIDDDQLTLEIVSWIFRDSSSSHRLFSDPDSAMAYLCESMPRVLVVDYYMPRQNGIDFLSQLSSRTDTTECAVYLCSAITPQKEQLRQVETLGAHVLDKAKICDRSSLLGLVASQRYPRGNE